MALFNVARTVVDLVEAPNAVTAERDLEERLRSLGFEVYDGEQPVTFESEDP